MFQKPRDQYISEFTFPEVGVLVSEEQAFLAAYCAAHFGLGYVKSNPLVGAVLVNKEHKYIACGGHRRYGESHAEIDLIRAVEAMGMEGEFDGGTVYVTLEPCAHFGKTPPCAQALARLPLARVVYGQHDPFPLVDGRGAKMIRAAQIKCELARNLPYDSNDLSRMFMHHQKSSRPYVALKIASSLNGIFAFRNSRRSVITGARSREFGHFLRQEFDGIVIGLRTLFLDDPSLTVRSSYIDQPRSPVRIVLDEHFQIGKLDHQQYKMFQDSRHLVVVRQGAVDNPQVAAKFQLLEVPSEGDFLLQALELMASAGIGSVLVEGGAHTWGRFLSAGVVDYLYNFTALDFLGSSEAELWSSGLCFSSQSIKDSKMTKLGDQDLLIEGRLELCQKKGVL